MRSAATLRSLLFVAAFACKPSEFAGTSEVTSADPSARGRKRRLATQERPPAPVFGRFALPDVSARNKLLAERAIRSRSATTPR